MIDWHKFFTSINVLIFQKTNGRLGNRMGRQSVLLLHTIGRKSEKSYVNSLSYYREGINYLVVASNWGKETDPDWFTNLMQHPQTLIQVGVNEIEVDTHQAEGEDYRRLWELVTEKNAQYLHYQKDINRQIPIVVLTPITSERAIK